jgi:hypothetical protein
VVSPVQPDNSDFATRLIRQAARETGADFNFLVDTAARESNFDAGAQARTSSAAGMFQFIEQTWLGMMQRHGDQHGFAELSGAISQDSNGRFTVADPQKRQEILDLRFDAQASARMAGELASENSDIIQARIGRRPNSGELYAAHFLGANGAAGLIHAAETTPGRRADEIFPAAASANRSIFFEGGSPRSVRDVLSSLTGGHGSAPVRQAPAASMARLGTAQASASLMPTNFAPTPIAYDGPLNPGSYRVGSGELSPALVEILASLDAPKTGRVRET